jgi:hypothetical protein
MNLKELDKTLSIKGKSGVKYVFKIYELNEDIEKLSDICSNFEDGTTAIYVFTKRVKHCDKTVHRKIYCGKSEDLCKRFYNHKEDILNEYDANCISIHRCMKNDLKNTEQDILLANKFSLNNLNNSWD